MEWTSLGHRRPTPSCWSQHQGRRFPGNAECKQVCEPAGCHAVCALSESPRPRKAADLWPLWGYLSADVPWSLSLFLPLRVQHTAPSLLPKHIGHFPRNRHPSMRAGVCSFVSLVLDQRLKAFRGVANIFCLAGLVGCCGHNCGQNTVQERAGPSHV